MNLLLEAFNKPVKAFRRADARLSWTLVALTIGMVVILDPVLRMTADITGVNPGINVIQVMALSARLNTGLKNRK